MREKWCACLAMVVFGGLLPLSLWGGEKPKPSPGKDATKSAEPPVAKETADPKPAHDTALFDSGAASFEKQAYRKAARQLEEALHSFPNSPRAPRCDNQLADAYRLVAIAIKFDLRKKRSTTPRGRIIWMNGVLG